MSFARECADYKDLSPLQKGRLEFAYNSGVDYDLGFTMAAIALQESSAGKYRLNLESKDLGLFQVNVKTASSILKVTNHYKKIELVERMIYDDVFTAKLSLHVLTYFKDYHKGDWKKTIQSYNAGFSINNEDSLDYLDKVSSNVKMLQKCMKL